MQRTSVYNNLYSFIWACVVTLLTAVPALVMAQTPANPYRVAVLYPFPGDTVASPIAGLDQDVEAMLQALSPKTSPEETYFDVVFNTHQFLKANVITDTLMRWLEQNFDTREWPETLYTQDIQAWMDTTFLRPDDLVTIEAIATPNGNIVFYFSRYQVNQNFPQVPRGSSAFSYDYFQKIIVTSPKTVESVTLLGGNLLQRIKWALHRLFPETNAPPSVRLAVEGDTLYDCHLQPCPVKWRSIDPLVVRALAQDVDNRPTDLTYDWDIPGGPVLHQELPRIRLDLPRTDSAFQLRVQVPDGINRNPRPHTLEVKSVGPPRLPRDFHDHYLINIWPYGRQSYSPRRGGVIWGSLPVEEGGPYPLRLTATSDSLPIPVVMIPLHELPTAGHSQNFRDAPTRDRLHTYVTDSLRGRFPLPDSALFVYYAPPDTTPRSGQSPTHPQWYYHPYHLPLGHYQLHLHPEAEGLTFPPYTRKLTLAQTRHVMTWRSSYWHHAVPRVAREVIPELDSLFLGMRYGVGWASLIILQNKFTGFQLGGSVNAVVDAPRYALYRMPRLFPGAFLQVGVLPLPELPWFHLGIGLQGYYIPTHLLGQRYHYFYGGIAFSAYALLLNIAEVGDSLEGAFAPRFPGDQPNGLMSASVDLNILIPSTR